MPDQGRDSGQVEGVWGSARDFGRRGVAANSGIIAAETEAEPAEREALKASFRRMIHRLPGPYREAILLTEFEGLSQVEMARRLGISVSGAKSRVQRGRQQLKNMLLDCCHFEFDRRGRVFDCQARRNDCPQSPSPPVGRLPISHAPQRKIRSPARFAD